MDFPKTVYGRCEELGHLGPDYSSVSHSDAEVVRGDTGTGYVLVEFNGRFICKPCKRRLLSDQESIEGSRKHAREERFRASAGYEIL